MIPTVEEIQPNLVIFSAQLLKTAATLLESANVLHKNDTPVAFGGRIFNIVPELRDKIPGIFLGETLADAVVVIENSLAQMPKIPAPDLHPQNYKNLSDQFMIFRSAIEAEVYQNYTQFEIPASILKMANDELGDILSASLKLGDIAYADVEIAWLSKMLSHKDGDKDKMTQYLDLYAHAAQKHLGPGGDILFQWLTNTVGAYHEHTN
jgi:hypothetical protein